jgi:hypothetical protein
MRHDWPTDPDQHLWGPWQANTGIAPGRKPTQWRGCCHPDCKAVEYREAPRA